MFIIFPPFPHHFGDAVPTLPPFSPPGLPGGWRQPCGPFLTAAGGDGLQLFGRAREAGAVEYFLLESSGISSGFTWFYRTYPLEMDFFNGFMGKFWESLMMLTQRFSRKNAIYGRENND